MKIGQFAKTHQVSVDTLRHYMDLKLLVPVKEGAHYHFDERCGEEMARIVQLKKLGFSLAEIKSLLSFMRFGKMSDYQQDGLYRQIFEDRMESLEEEIGVLTGYLSSLRQEVKAMDQVEPEPKLSFGIPLDALSLFACPECGCELAVASAKVEGGEIYEGYLSCSCGTRLPIEDGILLAGENVHTEKEYNYLEHLSDYILKTPDDYIDRLYESIGWGYTAFENLDQKNKVAIDLGSGLGVFLRNIYDKVEDSLTYIVVDNNLFMHRHLKEILSRAPLKKRILFIAADFEDLPLKKDSVDIVVDVAGSSNYAFRNNVFLIARIDHLVKRESVLLCGLLMFDNFTPDSQISEERRWLFTQEPMIQAIESLGYHLETVRESERSTEGGVYEDFFMPGETVYTLLTASKRWG